MADRDDPDHQRCRDALRTLDGPVLVVDLVVTEVAYLLASRLGPAPEVAFLGSLARGELIVEHVTAGDWLRIAELVGHYHDLPLGTVDASIVAAAERLGVSTVVTLDERHFRVVRPAHVNAFTILP